jgi:plasmid maintenance system antidote protein VapI
MSTEEKHLGFSALAEQMGLSKSWISHCLAGRRRISEAQAKKLVAFAPNTKREWWLNLPACRAEIEAAVRQIRKARLTNAEYTRIARVRRKHRAAVEIVQSWEE